MLQLIVEGNSNKRIAGILGISEATAKDPEASAVPAARVAVPARADAPKWQNSAPAVVQTFDKPPSSTIAVPRRECRSEQPDCAPALPTPTRADSGKIAFDANISAVVRNSELPPRVGYREFLAGA